MNIATQTEATESHEGPGYRITLAPGVDRVLWLGRAQQVNSILAAAERVHTSHSALIDVLRLDETPLAIKHFPCRAGLKRLADRYRGTPARRAFEAAVRLVSRGIQTPRPVACVEVADGGHLREGLLITEWQEGYVSFKDALIECYTRGADSPHIMSLLRLVAEAVRDMHEAGVFHGDLGNQNILLRQTPDGNYEAPCFIDLNRARVQPVVSRQQRAFDLSRIHLPSDFLRIFQEMYFDAEVPGAFRRVERRYRLRFAWHTVTRRARHPLRTWRQRGLATTEYPPPRDLWVWDPNSAQAIATLRGRERRRLLRMADVGRMMVQSLLATRSVDRMARRLVREAFAMPVTMKHRIGIAISERPEIEAFEDGCLAELGAVHVSARFYAHQSSADWDRTADRLHRLHAAGHTLSVVLVQDRRAVTDPARWRAFTQAVLERVGGIVEDLQVGQALNRTKWGIWSFQEYAALARTVADAARACTTVKLLGPSIIDFEPHYLLGALSALPPSIHFDGVGHLLYVDRRGAPENRQGRRSTLEKLAVLRAIARRSPRTEDRLVISEVNWPLKDTGISSPICSPYLYSGQTVAGGVDETTYGYYMIRYLLIALCSGLADRVCWWRLCARGFGLVDDQDPAMPRKRPACFMFQTFVKRMEDAVFTGQADTAAGLHAFHFENALLGGFTLAYAEADAEDRRLSLPYERAEDACGKVIANFNGQLPADGAPIYLFDAGHTSATQP